MFPKIFQTGDFFLPTYGVLVAAGLLLALAMAGRLARRRGLDPDTISNIGVYAAIAGLVGAKLLMFVVDFDHYWKDPGEIFTIATIQAGGVFFGGLLGALGAAFWLMRRHKLDPVATLDVYAPALAAGQALGRLGCFAAGCCWGIACERPWAITFTNTDAHAITGVPVFIPIHPTQLYEAFAYAVIAGVTWWFFGRSQNPGSVMGLYLVLASGARFAIEFFRAPHQKYPFSGPLATSQWLAIGLVVAGMWLLVRRARSGGQRAA
jgi:phosphatidylglycerol:prolipoprotein diacylglycerol transferase